MASPNSVTQSISPSRENYEIRVVTKHAGKEHTISKVIDLAAGDDVELSFETSDILADTSLIEKTASIQ